ncbi:GNAT family N-acetyltransferase [Marinomonas mediterranea]|uniref:GNAT family N-acetyltransferase n=1 Tax=Marinomonas mediterranea TaxID=119864 RepID=UPI0023494AFE|nr:GNAT family N-acetyltransferase [Marinomonas mediterranea]WCN09649.1 GNAT family N-acetyltransferase [Marinomonas mediterranea]WCN13738.1 GNAT family N-acetyltransferase [Marinomonas mediterranea]
MLADTSKRLQTYELTIRELNEEDIDKLHELSVAVRWPHRPNDWKLLLSLGGKGFVGCDPIGRIVASAMWFPYGDDFVTIGMLITSPKLQTLGAGRWLMKHVMRECSGRHVLLNSTKAAYRLYESLSFRPIHKIYQHQGIATPSVGVPAPADTQIRDMEADDLESILALDFKAFGLNRSNVINTILEHATGTVLVRSGSIEGFSFCRKFGRGQVVGPIVSTNNDDAIALTAPHVSRHSGTFLRVDTSQQTGTFKDYLIRSGLAEYDTVTTMTNDQFEPHQGDVTCYALASQALS